MAGFVLFILVVVALIVFKTYNKTPVQEMDDKFNRQYRIARDTWNNSDVLIRLKILQRLAPNLNATELQMCVNSQYSRLPENMRLHLVGVIKAYLEYPNLF